MANKPHIIQQTLTGGAIFDPVTIPEKITRLVLKSRAGASILKLKFNSAAATEFLQIEIGQAYDSGEQKMEGTTVFVNGTGVLDGEYWT